MFFEFFLRNIIFKNNSRYKIYLKKFHYEVIMDQTNYIVGIVKILEIPKEKTINKETSVVKIRVQLSQIRNPKIVTLIFWDNLAHDIVNYYKINDYLIIEGFLSLRLNQMSEIKIKNLKKIEITVIRTYPFILSSDLSIQKV